MNNNLILNIAHRGARSLAPENTLAAARKALEAGAHMWELDVTLTRDGEFILIHDDTLERTSNAREIFADREPWAVSSFTLQEIRQLDFGSWFIEQDPFGQVAAGNVSAADQRSYVGERAPTLREALEFTRDHGWRVNVEMKKLPESVEAPGYVEKIVRLVEELGMVEQVLVSSFEHSYLTRLKALNPDIGAGALVFARVGGTVQYLDSLGLSPGIDACHPMAGGISDEEIRTLRERGYGVNVWTVNDGDTMRALIEAGVTGIITDFPQVVTAILLEYRSTGGCPATSPSLVDP